MHTPYPSKCERLDLAHRLYTKLFDSYYLVCKVCGLGWQLGYDDKGNQYALLDKMIMKSPK